MQPQPLDIPDASPSDVRVLASGLELRNRENVERAITHNRENRDRKRTEAGRALREEAEVGAEFVRRRSNSTKNLRLEEVERHYGLSH